MYLFQCQSTTHDPRDGQRCTKDSECPTDECCVHAPLTIHQKRFFLGDLLVHDHGFCRMKRRENQTCTPLGLNILCNSCADFEGFVGVAGGGGAVKRFCFV